LRVRSTRPEDTTHGDGRTAWLLNAIDLVGWCSGVFAILLAVKRHRFLAQPRASQRWWALGIWLVHVAALGLFILIGSGFCSAPARPIPRAELN